MFSILSCVLKFLFLVPNNMSFRDLVCFSRLPSFLHSLRASRGWPEHFITQTPSPLIGLANGEYWQEIWRKVTTLPPGPSGVDSHSSLFRLVTTLSSIFPLYTANITVKNPFANCLILSWLSHLVPIGSQKDKYSLSSEWLPIWASIILCSTSIPVISVIEHLHVTGYFCLCEFFWVTGVHYVIWILASFWVYMVKIFSPNLKCVFSLYNASLILNSFI